ncbi:MAG: rRNA pseudouridine synthase [Bacteroidetes bacterium]|nr:rRNA pseudouridine synthase [Bacteroidota bacterium]
MANKKDNSGGKKFQNRLSSEKRVRVTKNTKNKSESSDRKRDFGNKPGGFKSGFKKDGDFSGKPGPKSFSDRKYVKKDRGDSGETGEFKKRTGGYNSPYKKDTGFGSKPGSRSFSDNKYKKKDSGESGDFKKRTGGYNSPYKKDSGYAGKPGPKSFSDRKYGKKDAGTDNTDFRKKSDRFSREDSKDKRSNYAGPKSRFDANKKRTFGPQENDSQRGKWERKGKPNNFKGSGKKLHKTSESLLDSQENENAEIRINRYIANSGLCSRREADVMISQGLVSINGQVVSELGTKVKKSDDVRVDGKRINPEKPVYILLNKPKGYITTTADPSERATVMDLIDLPGKERIYPVGRLDRNTTGVLLLTNDGELAQKLMHPSFEIKKIYKAGLDRKPSKDHMLAWVNGVELEDGFMNFEQVGFVDEEHDTVLGLEVHSGRNRIVRRMFEHYGYEVKSLDRVMLGDFDHVKLGRGKWRFLNDREIRYVEKLKRMRGKKPSKFED